MRKTLEYIMFPFLIWTRFLLLPLKATKCDDGYSLVIPRFDKIVYNNAFITDLRF